MAKPIFLLLLPHNTSMEMVAKTQELLYKELDDYNIMILPNTKNEVKAQVLSEKGGREIDIDALTETVKQALNDQCS
jgi:hypothetical protein